MIVDKKEPADLPPPYTPPAPTNIVVGRAQTEAAPQPAPAPGPSSKAAGAGPVEIDGGWRGCTGKAENA